MGGSPRGAATSSAPPATALGVLLMGWLVMVHRMKLGCRLMRGMVVSRLGGLLLRGATTSVPVAGTSASLRGPRCTMSEHTSCKSGHDGGGGVAQQADTHLGVPDPLGALAAVLQLREDPKGLFLLCRSGGTGDHPEEHQLI